MVKLSDSQLSASKKKKKKKKKKRVLRERLLNASSPQSSDHSLIFSGHDKKALKKKKERKEASEPPLDNTSVSVKSEITSETGDLIHKKKKKKKKKKMQRLLSASSPRFFDHSSVFSGHDDDEVGEALKEKEEQNKVSEPQLDNTLVSMESEITSETGVLVHKKKKKKKRVPAETEDVRVSQENSPGTDLPENLGGSKHVDERMPIKKKKKAKAPFLEQAKVSSPNTSKRNYIEPIGEEDTLEDRFVSTPLSPTPSSSLLSQRKEKEATALDTTVELCSPHVEKKSRKKRKRSCTKDANNADCLAKEENVDSADHDSQQTRSSPKQGASEGNNRLGNHPTPVHEAENKLTPPRRSPWEQPVQSNPFVESSEISRFDLHTATKELEVFIPQVRTLSAVAIKQLAQRDLIRFKNFQQEGVAVKFGKFTRKENIQLKKNVEAFLEVSGIESAERLFFPHRFPEEKLTINKLKVKHMFGIRIAEGIPRPWRLVYYRARKIFDPLNNSKKYSKKQVKKLTKYQAMYGNNWKKISELMSRSSHSIQMKYSQVKSKPNSGPWNKDEIRRLIQAVEEVIRPKARGLDSALARGNADKALFLMREHLYKGISWIKVEAKVGTRNWQQCKDKWTSVVTKRMTRGKCLSHGRNSLLIKIKLIERMYELNVEDVGEIDWEDLSLSMGNIPPGYVQRRFCTMKVHYVPNWNHKLFPEIIDYLYEEVLPSFKRRLCKLDDDAEFAAQIARQVEESEQKKIYKFSDIFWYSDDDLLDEEEEETLNLTSHEADPGSQKDSGSS